MTLSDVVASVEAFADQKGLDPLEVLNLLSEHYIPELAQLDLFYDDYDEELTVH